MRRRAITTSSAPTDHRAASDSRHAGTPSPPRSPLLNTLREEIRAGGSKARHVLAIYEAFETVSERHPTHLFRLGAVFMQLSWREDPSVSPDLLRAHAQELLERVVENQPLQPATAAEMLILLVKADMHVKLDHDARTLLGQLFQRTFGNERLPGLSKLVPEESWPPRARELFAQLQHRARDDSRQLPSASKRATQDRGTDNSERSAP